MKDITATPRTQVRRLPQRAVYDREVIHAGAEFIDDARPEVDTDAPVDDAADQTADEPSDVEHVAVELDTRSAAQRLHDALKLGLRAALASGVYGQHRGLPVTVIATTTPPTLSTTRPSRCHHRHAPAAARAYRCATYSAWPPTRSTTW